MKESQKERTKLIATGFNTLAVNTAVAGAVVPIASYLCVVPSAPTWERLLPAALVWPLAAFVLHLLAQLVLRDLDPPTDPTDVGS